LSRICGHWNASGIPSLIEPNYTLVFPMMKIVRLWFHFVVILWANSSLNGKSFWGRYGCLPSEKDLDFNLTIRCELKSGPSLIKDFSEAPLPLLDRELGILSRKYIIATNLALSQVSWRICPRVIFNVTRDGADSITASSWKLNWFHEFYYKAPPILRTYRLFHSIIQWPFKLQRDSLTFYW
jgi:hypothetical protein